MTATKTLFESSGWTLLDRIGNNSLKRRLQFSGWLQYAPLGVFSAILLAAGNAVLGTSLFGLFVYDVLTVKFRKLRPFHDKAITSDRERLKEATDIEVMWERHSCKAYQPHLLATKDRDFIINLAAQVSRSDALFRDATPGTTGATTNSTQIRFEFVHAPLKVWPVIGAQEFLVAVGPKIYNRRAIVNVGYALENVVLQATKRGIATCWIGPGTDQNSVIAELDRFSRFDSERDHIILSCAFGYESYYVPLVLRLMVRLITKHRLPITKLFFSDEAMKEPVDVSQPPFQDYAQCMEACRWSPSSFNAQPVRAICIMDKDKNKLKRIDFYACGPSRYYSVVALGIWLRHWETACQELGRRGRFDTLDAASRGYSSPDDHTYDISWVVCS